MAAIVNAIPQSFCIPEPTLTEKNLHDLSGKVSIVTGGYAGVGYELSKILYSHNGTVYLAGRSPGKGAEAIKNLKELYPESKGRVEFLKLDLGDLNGISEAAAAFASKESQLHVLTNNAGVMVPPQGSTTVQVRENMRLRAIRL
jgi:retinol dehydrogenase 12